jgi:RNA polymerase sigma factor (sigma-70 family)
LNEQELIERLKQGDEGAFKTIVETWQDMVYNTSLGIVQNAGDAEDIAQEVFVRVYESVGSFKGESKFSTWLYRITVTRSIDFLRKKKRKKRFGILQSIFGNPEGQAPDPPDFHHPGVILANKEKAAVLFKAIEKLPENQKIAFTLHKVEGLSYKEISDIMGTTLAAVESLIHRARLNLQKHLKQYYENK